MNIGFIGLGKLGLSCALAIERYGRHSVCGTDANPVVMDNIRRRHLRYREEGAQPLLDETNLVLTDVEGVVGTSDIVFVAVQTPHDPRFEGIAPMPEERADFDYTYLVASVKAVAEAALALQKPAILAIISTVLPGTVEREIRPLLNEYTRLCYNPFFIAMGTTIHDFMHPEFVLMGADTPETAAVMRRFYGTLHDAQVVEMSIESAELTKVAYNTFIGMKIVFANTLMEICEGTGANVDHVTDALSLATTRLISPKYLRAGMGDGGGCHPRDNIAMSWLARRLDLSYDFFESLMLAREKQTEWLAYQAIVASKNHGLPIVVMGKAFKPETNLTVGSPAILLNHFLDAGEVQVTIFDPYVDGGEQPTYPAIYVVATRHEVFATWPYATNSIVLDPWGYVHDREGVCVRQIGRTRGDVASYG